MINFSPCNHPSAIIEIFPSKFVQFLSLKGDPKARLQSETRVRVRVKENEREAVLILFFDS